MSFKSGGTGTTNSAQQWKERAEELAEQLIESAQEKDELQSRLDEIAEIAAPDRAADNERLERIEDMIQRLIDHAGLGEVQEETVSEGQ